MDRSQIKLRAAFLVFAVFIVGAALGGISVHIFENRVSANRSSSNRPNLLERMNQEVGLTPDQRVRVSAILDETRMRFAVQRQQITDEARQRIMETLTNEQRIKMEGFFRQLDTHKLQK